MRVDPNAPARPALRYYGGKWRLAPWIISHMPKHRIYTEAFCGAASVLLQKPRVYAEVLNDLDGELVNFFRVLRDPAMGRELKRQVELTPFARAEFELSYAPDGDPIEQARRTLFRSFAGFGSAGVCGHQTGFRSNVTRSGTTPAIDWRNFADVLPEFVQRLRGVIIENAPAGEVIERYDNPDALHYVDPPYPSSTRNQNGHYKSVYRHEMGEDEQHRELAARLRAVKGCVIISGYACELYGEIYPNWIEIQRDTYADGAQERTESLWLSPRTWAALNEEMSGLPLFEGVP